MRIVGETKFDFMAMRGMALGLSALLVIASIGIVAVDGIKKGVEFAGGAHVILRYIDPPAIEEVRAQLIEQGLSGSSVTAFGGSDGAEIVVRVPLPEGEEEGSRDRDMGKLIVEALRPQEVRDKIAQGMIDLNTADQVTLERTMVDFGMDELSAAAAAEAISVDRKQHGGVFPTLEDALKLPQVSDQARAFLEKNAFVGPFALRGQEFIEASISGEMRNKAFGAILGALGGMLIYIWFRFKFQWGLAAIIALVHDTVITLGAFSLMGMEANLPVVAAFLTLVGYSVNDTIVVFDRIRENIRDHGESRLSEMINLSINQNLSRTLITSLTTLLAVASLFFLGGPVIHPFAFVLLVGIVVGTYSSIYIASPILMIWQRLFGGTGARKARHRSGVKVSS